MQNQTTNRDPPEPKATVALPLAVDLDGTLIKADVFLEAIIRYVFAHPFGLFTVLGWLLKGRAFAKAQLARATPTNPALLPYDERVIAWLREERAKGRRLVLATAADQSVADAVAGHVGLFDAAIGSDGRVNLKSLRKQQRLAALFPQGFVYAGNERADLTVWAKADAAVVVNAAPALDRAAARRFKVERSFPRESGALRGFVKAIRPQQWAKNVLVFLPMLLGQGWTDLNAWIAAAITFVAISFAASSVYLVNDAADIDADRSHPRKKRRPFASGALSPALGLAASVGLAGAGVAMGALAGVAPLVILYVATSSIYTFWLKRKRLVDVFLLAGLFMLRIVIGGLATGYLASPWLLAFSCFFFLSLALAKRAIEVQLAAAGGGGGLSRRGYLASDGFILKAMGVGASFAACLVLTLYLQSEAVVSRYGSPELLWGLSAVVMFWLCRVWLLTDRGELHDDPLVWAVSDWVSYVVGAAAAACFIAALLIPPGLFGY